jgi:hypothetical protein
VKINQPAAAAPISRNVRNIILGPPDFMVNRLFLLYYNEYFNTVSAVLAERKECTFKADIAMKKCWMKGFTWCFVSVAFPCESDKMTRNNFKEVFGCLGHAKNYILRQTRFKNTTKIVARKARSVKSE